MIHQAIQQLVLYGIRTGLTPPEERIYTTNLILDVLNLDSYAEPEEPSEPWQLETILEKLLTYAVSHGLAEDNTVSRDLFDTKLMNCLMPRPAQVQKTFWEKYDSSPKVATDYYYELSQNSDYIRRYRVCKDLKWTVDTEYGTIDITINLSKPEKDPKAIAAAKAATSVDYPKCLLCMENEGYAGRLNHPARENHRIIPLTLGNTGYALQYSPYVYYNEHCIVFNQQHTPMEITPATFRRLFDFVKQFPHYFLGSNADLPIVGGSILTHDHFQGGCYSFAMEKAPVEYEFTVKGYEDVQIGIVKWPLSVLRLRCSDEQRVIALASHILEIWRNYTDEEAFLFAHTNGENHNTITPIARYRDSMYELDLALRNNLTTAEYPLGVYHPHSEYHHIKKENIGLIEVMGLAVLPARLKTELELLKEYILEKKDIRSNDKIAKHAQWVEEFLPKYTITDEASLTTVLQQEVGFVFTKILENAGVFKRNPSGFAAFQRFIEQL